MMANASTKAIGKAIAVAASTIIIGIVTGIVTIAITTATKGAQTPARPRKTVAAETNVGQTWRNAATLAR